MDREEFLEIYYRAVEENSFERDGTNGDESRIHIGKGEFATVSVVEADDMRDFLFGESSIEEYNDSGCADHSYIMTGQTINEWATEEYDAGSLLAICPRRYASYSVDFESSEIEIIECGEDTICGTEVYRVVINNQGNKDLEYVC